jgi:hypothetical protein
MSRKKNVLMNALNRQWWLCRVEMSRLMNVCWVMEKKCLS